MRYTKVTDLTTGRTRFVKKLLWIVRSALSPKTTTNGHSDVYTLPGHSLPSQYRTLLPIVDADIQRLLKVEKRRRFIRNITLALAALIVFFIVVIISLIVILQLSLNSKRGHLQLTAIHVNKTHFHVDEIKLLKAKAMVKPSQQLSRTSNNFPSKSGVRCITKCWDYAAFRFKSECVDGYCLCRDRNYDDVTCLPKTHNCAIQQHQRHPFFRATHSGNAQTSYSCTHRTGIHGNEPEIHVISMYSNNNVNSTAIHFKSSKKINVTLILVSYEPVVWDISLDDNVSTQDIILISHYGVSRTKVIVTDHKSGDTITSTNSEKITSTNSEINRTNPSSGQIPTLPLSEKAEPLHPSIRVSKLLIQTGYGDDRESGNTPFLLSEITRRIGPISSFFGIAKADDIVFDIGLGTYQLNSLHKGTAYKTTFGS